MKSEKIKRAVNILLDEDCYQYLLSKVPVNKSKVISELIRAQMEKEKEEKKNG